MLRLVLVAAVAFGYLAVAMHAPLRAIAALYGALAVVAAVAVVLRRRGLTERPPIVVGTDVIVLPAGAFTTRTRTIALDDVTSIERRGSARRPLLVVGTHERPFVLPADALVDGDGVARLRDAVRAATIARPDGLARVAAMAAREATGRSAGRRAARGTMALVAVVAIVFAIELATGALDSRTMLLRLGANSPILVRQGEWWRPITANLLHLSFLHLYFNAGALLSLGTMLERSLGTSRFVVAALTAGVAGMVTSVYAGRMQVVSAGASAIAFGLMGALLFVNVRHRRDLPAGYLIGWRQWLFLLGINGAISLLPFVDGLAHLGGLIGGALPMVVLANRLEMRRGVRTVATAAATVLVLVYVVGVGAAAVHFVTDRGDPTGRLAAGLLDGRAVDVERLNDLAWTVATDRRSPRDLLVRAETAARRAAEAMPDDGNVLDTQAYLLHRLGRTDDAIARERRAAWLAPSSGTFTMLHRFLVERSPTTTDAGRIDVVNGALVVAVPGRAGAVVYGSVRGDDGAAGLLRVVLPADAETARTPLPPDFPDDARVDVLLADVDPSRPEQPRATPRATYHALDDATRGLP